MHVRFSNHDGARGVLIFAAKADVPSYLVDLVAR